jgi:hypothetical protein
LLPPDAEARRAFSNLVQTTLPAIAKLNVESQRRFSRVLQLLGRETALGQEMAAE